MTQVGIIGAGHIGSTLARGFVERGYDVKIANSRGPETLADLVSDLGDRATAGTAEEAAAFGEIVVVTLWEQEGGPSPPRVPRRFTDALGDA